jgi:hypothetical protein
MLTRARAAVLVFAGLTLAACGSIHPGDAAVVDGQSISMKTFERTARLFCERALIEVKQQGQSSIPNDQVRQQAIVNLVKVIVARDVAKQEGVSLAKEEYELPAAQIENIRKEYPNDEDAKTVESIYEGINETGAIAIALGEKSSGITRTAENQNQLYSEGSEEIQKALKDHDIEISPRFGVSDTLKLLNRTGSVSVPDVNYKAPTDEELPPAQRCA